MSSFIHSGVNFIRNAGFSPLSREERESMKKGAALLKLAALVGTIATGLFFGIFPNLFTFTLLGLVGYASYETFAVADNVQSIASGASSGIAADINIRTRDGTALINQLTEGAPVYRIAINALTPPPSR